MNILIDILTNNPLNIVERLNFLDFKKAFEFYINSKEKNLELEKMIDSIIGGMNKLITNF